MQAANANMDTLIHKANGYAMQGDFGTSLGFILQAYELCEKEFGTKALDTLACAGLAGRTYAAMGRSDDALRFFSMVYEGLKESLGEESMKTQHALRELEDYKSHIEKFKI